MLSEKLLEYQDDGLLLEGLLVTPDEAQGPLPGVIIAHAWGGRGEVEENCARRLAEHGYAALAIDMYGKGVRGASREQNAALIAPFLSDRARLAKRITCSFNTLQEYHNVDSTKIAALGYCFGGLCVLDLARSGVPARGVISVHGLFTPPPAAPSQPIRAKVLALHGHRDPMVPVEAVNQLEAELTAASADWQIHVYGRAMHAFTNPRANDPEFGTVYDADADRRSWTAITAFLEEVLG